MNVLVTGAGLVGCNVAHQLKERGDKAVLFDRSPNREYIAAAAPGCPVVAGDVQDLSILIDTMQKEKIDVVLHTAYLIGLSLMERPYTGVRANVDGGLALMEAARLTGVKRFLLASTQGVYNYDVAKGPITEDAPLIGSVYYTASKISLELLLPIFAQQYSIEFAILRFAQIYGYGHYLGGDFVGQVTGDALAAGLAGKPVNLDPGIITNNDHVYAKDVGAGCVLACDKLLKHPVYNLGSGKLTGPSDVVAAIDAALPNAKAQMLPKPVIGPYWVHDYYLDITRARQDWGYEPKYDLAKGVADFVSELRSAGSKST